MMRWSWALVVGSLGFSSVGWAQAAHGVAEQNSTAREAVAAEQRDIRVGDVIMAPAVDPSPSEVRESDEAGATAESWRPGARGEREAKGAKQRWYGAPTLVVDGVSVALVLAGAGADGSASAGLAAMAVPGYLLGGPIVHAVNGHGWRAGGSLLLRGGGSIAGLMLSAAATDCAHDGGTCVEDLAVGLALGSVVAIAIDLSLLHWEDVPAPEPQRSGASLMPQLAFDRERVVVGASGTF
jgi:hypothetical protein